MKASEIKVGGHYQAKISNRLVVVRVDGIRQVPKYRRNNYGSPVYTDTNIYDVTNTVTKRKTLFKSAGKFRKEVSAPT